MYVPINILMPKECFVSVLLPTRKRTRMVEHSVASVLSLATDPSQIEIAVAYDDDDEESHNYFSSDRWKTFVGSRGGTQIAFQCPNWGYSDLHNYYNLMAERSRGRWLLVWNDDAVMLTPGWDQQLKEIEHFQGMVHMHCTTYPKLTLFPLFPRSWVDFFGCAAGGPHIDSWIQDICYEAGTVKKIQAEILHDRFSETGNNNDETFQNRTWHGKKLYKSDGMRKVRHEWAQRWAQRCETLAK